MSDATNTSRAKAAPARLPATTTGCSPVLYRIPDVVDVLGLSRSAVYELIRSCRLKTVKEGRTRLVPASAIAEYVELLVREAEAKVRDEAA